MGWVESGQAWGERAADWAYLVEPYVRRVNEALFDRLGVVQGTRLLDIACGSGYAANLAAGRGGRGVWARCLRSADRDRAGAHPGG